MKGVVTSAVLRDIDVSFQTQFNKAMSEVPDFIAMLCMLCPSNSAENIYGWLASLPQIGKKTAEIIKTRLQMLGQTVRNEEFAGIIEVPRTAIEDDQYGLFGPVAAMWGQRAGLAPVLELINWLKLSFTTAKAYTGKSFFATDHKAHNKAVEFSNRGTKKLSAANFQAAYANLRGRKDAEGIPLFNLLNPAKVYLVVCEDDEAVADSIVRLETLSTGGKNPNYNKAKVIVMPGLQPAGNDRPWFLLDCGAPVGPLVYQPRAKFEITPNFSLTSDRVFNEDLFSWKARGRFAIAGGLPEKAYGSTGADAA